MNWAAVHFQDKVEIEQIRTLEESGSPLLAQFDGQRCASFSAWLKARTQALKQQKSVADAVAHGPHLYQRIAVGMGVLLTLLGIISTSSLLSGADNTLNIFWLLGALLGINLLSLILWCLFAIGSGRSNAGIIAPLLHRVMLWLAPAQPGRSAKASASRAWFRAQLNPLFHHWYLGRLTHLAWCCYLAGSIVGLLLLFATRQFNFIWESTLLDAQAFVQLSRALAAPLEWLGLPAPSESDIIHSGRNQAELYSGALRQQWALFLLACIALYGLLPRVIAAVACYIAEWRGRRRWQLDFSAPYYRQLQRQYAPAHRSTIVDPDTQSAPAQREALSFADQPVPSNAYWVGIELHPQLPWPGMHSPAFLGQVTDGQSLSALSNRIGELDTPLAIAVEARKAPDRGVQRTVRQLLKHSREPWLALIDTGDVSESKWQNWLNTAHELGFAEQQVTRMAVKP